MIFFIFFIDFERREITEALLFFLPLLGMWYAGKYYDEAGMLRKKKSNFPLVNNGFTHNVTTCTCTSNPSVTVTVSKRKTYFLSQ